MRRTRLKKEDRTERLKAIGVDADGLLQSCAALVATHTVQKYDAAGKPSGTIKPDAAHVRSLVQKVITQSDISAVEQFVENELVELLA